MGEREGLDVHISIAPSKITSRIKEDRSASVQSKNVVNLQTN
jgi:hypothetical protein